MFFLHIPVPRTLCAQRTSNRGGDRRTFLLKTISAIRKQRPHSARWLRRWSCNVDGAPNRQFCSHAHTFQRPVDTCLKIRSVTDGYMSCVISSCVFLHLLSHYKHSICLVVSTVVLLLFVRVLSVNAVFFFCFLSFLIYWRDCILILILTTSVHAHDWTNLDR